jgi:hypothetical protein
MPTTTELDARRLAYLEETIFPGVRDYFTRYPQLRSACVLVAQYWNDEAHDAVHAEVVISVLETPNLDAHFQASGWDEETGDNLKDVVNTPFTFDTFDLYMKTRWDSNEEAVPLFQAFCLDGSQEWSDEENYRPYCIVRRDESTADGTTIQVVGQLLRPHLDGVNPEEERW